MKILLDVDGVVADWLGHFLDLANEYFGTSYHSTDVVGWDAYKWLNNELAANYIDARMDISKLRVIPGSQLSVDKLRDAGHHVVFVTASSFYKPRVAWLHEHFGAHRDDVVVTTGKHHIPGDVFVDDKVANVESWRLCHPTKAVYLFDQPYNRDSLLPRIYSLSELTFRQHGL